MRQRHHAAMALHDVQLAVEADLAQPVLDAVQVAAGHRPDVGVDQRGHEALVLAHGLGDLARDRHEHGRARAPARSRAARRSWASLRTDQRKRDRDRVHPGSDTSASAAAATSSSSSATTSSPWESIRSDHAVHPRSADQRLGLVGLGHLEQRSRAARRWAGPCPRMMRVVSSKPAVVISPMRRALALHHDVGGHRGAVRDEAVHAPVDVGAGDAELFGGRLDGAEEARLE